MFSFGSAEKGQLGNGTTGERIITGNKTGYDIEVQPGSFSLIFSSIFISWLSSSGPIFPCFASPVQIKFCQWCCLVLIFISF